jgi:hypothetical protein
MQYNITENKYAQLHTIYNFTKKICTQATYIMHPYILDIALLKKHYATYML